MSSNRTNPFFNNASNPERAFDNGPVYSQNNTERSPRDQAEELARSMAHRLDAAARALGLTKEEYRSEKQLVDSTQDDGKFDGSASDLIELEAIPASSLGAQASDAGGSKLEAPSEGAVPSIEAQSRESVKFESDEAGAGVESETERKRALVSAEDARRLLAEIGYGGQN